MTFLEMVCIPQHIVKMCKPQPVRVPPHKVSTKCGQGAEIGYNKNMGNEIPSLRLLIIHLVNRLA